MAEYRKPIPGISTLNRPYWEALTRHEFKMQRCNETGRFWYPPTPWSPFTHTKDYEWAELSGKGKITTWMEQKKPWIEISLNALGSFDSELPYNVVEVELEEGPRIISNLVDVEAKDIHIGMPVEIVFDDVDEHLTLAKFRPVKEG